MSAAVNTHNEPQSLGMLRAIIIAGVAAFVLGGLTALISKEVAASPTVPVASSSYPTAPM